MQTIRTFIAIPLADDILRGAARLIDRVRGSGDGIKWVPADNLHLTLKFLGEVDNTEVPRVCQTLRSVVEPVGSFELGFSGTGGFPDLERPRVLWAGVEDDSGCLVQIVARLEAELAELGFKPEPRDYRPHLTLGRTRGGSRRADAGVIERMRQQQDVDLGAMMVQEVRLMASFLDKAGPTYQVMDTIRLDSD